LTDGQRGHQSIAPTVKAGDLQSPAENDKRPQALDQTVHDAGQL
jgi:hypothetical protein